VDKPLINMASGGLYTSALVPPREGLRAGAEVRFPPVGGNLTPTRDPWGWDHRVGGSFLDPRSRERRGPS
jgi:hypothetical protein